jgi:kynureninase
LSGVSERDTAATFDASDTLAAFRREFHIPQHDGHDSLYLCGHSLGLAPRAAHRIVNEELTRWSERGVEGHFESPRPWVSYHEQLTAGLAALVGALPGEVVAMNSLTVDLHLLLASFYRPTPARHRLMIEERAFSSDQYAVASHARLHGFDPNLAVLRVGPRAGEHVLRTDDLCTLIEREAATLATLVLPGVQYLTGQRLDIRAITQCARKHGVMTCFDLAHAIGNVPLSLHDWDVDCAVWCGYKYLNGGPGAIGGAFVHERHAHAFDLPRLTGWWGHDKRTRFEMPDRFVPLAGAEGWQVSNPPVLAAAPLIASLDVFGRAGMPALREKSLRLTGYLERLLRSTLPDAVEILTPATADDRGCQLSLRLRRSAEDARHVHEALTRHGVACDWREPDVIRVAPVPLYNTFTDVHDFVVLLDAMLRV